MTIIKQTDDNRYVIKKIEHVVLHNLFNNKGNAFKILDFNHYVENYLAKLGFENFDCTVQLNDDGFKIKTILIEDRKKAKIHPFSGCSELAMDRWLYLYNESVRNSHYRDFVFFLYDYLKNNKVIKEVIDSDFDGIYGDDLYIYQSRIENMVLANFPYHSERMEEIRNQQIDFFNASFQAMWDYVSNYNCKELTGTTSKEDFDADNKIILKKVLSKYYRYS